MSKNAAAYPGLWIVIYTSLCVALSSFLSRIHDETRLQFREAPEFMCTYVSTDFTITNSTATSTKPDELTAILATAIALTAIAAAAHTINLAADNSSTDKERDAASASAAPWAFTAAHCFVAMDSNTALVVNTLILATAFVALGFTYTVVISTRCTGEWADPRFNDVTAVIGVSVAYVGLFYALLRAVIANYAQQTPGNSQPHADTQNPSYYQHARRLLLATALTAQFGFSAAYFGGFDENTDVLSGDNCKPSAANKDNFAWIILCITTSTGLLWALLILRDFASDVLLTNNDKPKVHNDSAIHQNEPTLLSVRKLSPLVQAETVLFFVRLIGMPVALNTMFLTRVVDVTCTPLTQKLDPASPSGDDLHWQIFALVVGDFLIFAYTIGMTAVAHTPVLTLLYTNPR